MSVGAIRVVMTLDSTGFHSGITNAGRSLRNINTTLADTTLSVNTLGRHFTGIGHNFREFIVTASLAKGAIQNINDLTTGFAFNIAKTNGEIERMTMLMKGMSTASTEAGKAAEAVKDVDAIFAMAKNAPVEVKALTDVFVKLKTTGIDPLTGSMQALIDANAHFGGNSDTLHRAAIGIQQMASKGRVSMEELRQQLAEAIPNAAALMARGVGLSMEEFIQKVSTGQVKSKEALVLMYEQFELEFAGSAKNMMNTWVGLTSNLETEWTLFQKVIGDTGAFDAAKSAMRELVGAFRTDEAIAAGAAFGHMLADLTNHLITATKYVLENRDAVITWTERAVAVVIAVKSWGLVKEIMTATIAVGSALIPALVSVATSIVTTGTAAGATAALVTGFEVALAAIGGPITLITAALMAGAYAWATWGDSAEETMARATQSVKDGVRIQTGEIEKLDKIIEKGVIAAKAKAFDEAHPVAKVIDTGYKNFTSYFGGTSLDEDINKAEAVLKQKQEDKITGIKLNAKKLITAQTDAAKEIKINADTLAKSQLVDSEKEFTNKDGKIDRNKYNDVMGKIRVKAYDEQIAGINKVSDAFIAQEKAAGRSTEALEKNRKTLIDDLKSTRIERELAAPNPFGDPKKKSGASSAETAAKKAATKAASVAAQYENHTANLAAQLARKQAELAQPYGLGAGVTGPGPEEARIRSLMESGKRFRESDVQLAVQLDATNKKLEDRGKAAETVIAISKQEAASQEKLNIEIGYLNDTMKNNGYPVMSKNSLALEERLAVLKGRLYDVKSGLSTEEFKTETEAMLKNATATEGLSKERDKLSAANRSVRQTQVINASLITNTRDRLDAQYSLTEKEAMAENFITQDMYNKRVAGNKEAYDLIDAMRRQHAREMEGPLDSMARSWGDMTQNMKDASTGWMSSFTDELVNMTMTGKLNFRNMTISILSDIAKIVMQKQMAGLINTGLSIVGAASGQFGTSGGGLGSINDAGTTGAFANFATGGIMTSMGKLPLNAYASGGIAKEPQVAIFGEGRKNEAFVPLPDGKSIPVTMKGGDGGTVVSIAINVDSKGGESKDQKGTQGSGDPWGKMAEGVKNVVMQTLIEQKRPGGVLWQ